MAKKIRFTGYLFFPRIISESPYSKSRWSAGVIVPGFGGLADEGAKSLKELQMYMHDEGLPLGGKLVKDVAEKWWPESIKANGKGYRISANSNADSDGLTFPALYARESTGIIRGAAVSEFEPGSPVSMIVNVYPSRKGGTGGATLYFGLDALYLHLDAAAHLMRLQAPREGVETAMVPENLERAFTNNGTDWLSAPEIGTIIDDDDLFTDSETYGSPATHNDDDDIPF